MVGPHVFANNEAAIKDDANRHLLVELCTSLGMAIANTFFDATDEQKVTCHNVGQKKQRTISWASHSQIDFVLCPRAWQHSLISANVDRNACLSSHHFLLEASLQMDVPKPTRAQPRALPTISGLSCSTTANRFAVLMSQSMEDMCEDNPGPTNLDIDYARLVDAFKHAAKETLPCSTRRPLKPWISSRTLALIEKRQFMRQTHDVEGEQKICKEIRRSVAKDRSEWLDSLVASGEWGKIRQLRKGFAPKQGRLKDTSGNLVDSDCRADTLAEHLEKVQWAVRPMTFHPERAPLYEDLGVATGEITDDEVIRAAGSLKINRACGMDGVPAEFWKAILSKGSPALRWGAEFCRRCWSEKTVPEAWHNARVAMLFKKGDPADCNNYRPISLLAIGYKLFATILLNRLRDAGAEKRLWTTQFGFCRRRGTVDAIFLARRVIDEVWRQKDGKGMLLALDWAKAFDSISPTALAGALRRFGCTPGFIDMISAIYDARRFVVHDNGHSSHTRPQEFGIVQGCPLSPFLFVILMSVMLHDAEEDFKNSGLMSSDEILHLRTLVYADDTLIIDVDAKSAEAFMKAIGEKGAEYGLYFNWSKLEVLPLRQPVCILKADGKAVATKEGIVYLGSLLSADGRLGGELGRRIGFAQADFASLTKVWRHANIHRKRKLHIFDACVVSKLTYGLLTAQLNKVERRRLDGFQARCLRRILGIPASFYSRVPNAIVLEIAGAAPLSHTVLKQQMLFMGKVARRDAHDPVRQAVFDGDGFDIKQAAGPRSRGRPRQQWGPCVHKNCLQVAGSKESLAQYFRAERGTAAEWQRIVSEHVIA